MTRVLVFSTLYPNGAQPNHGVFVENRLKETVALGGLEATVVAPVPYFPSAHPVFGRYAAFAAAPRREARAGLEVWHPRYPVMPKFGATLAPAALYQAGLRTVRRLRGKGQDFDVIDAHYFYPDGVAAAHLARKLRLPVVITARGSDLTQIPSEPAPRLAIQWAAREASASIAVCEDLRRRVVELGAPAERSLVLRNGVDLSAFAPVDPAQARAAVGTAGFTILSVGALIPRKGHELTIEALRARPEWRLVIAGSGPLRSALESLAARLGVGDRVRFLGEVAHRELPTLYSAADVMVLASLREGWANVLLESMACGTPVVASDVNGASEVVRASAAGRLMRERSVAELINAVEEVRASDLSSVETRRYAERFSWAETAAANRALLTAAASAGFARRHDPQIVAEALRHVSTPEERAA